MIKVLDKTLDILEAVALASPAPVRVSELAARFGLNVATTSRILRDLADRDYVERADRLSGYRIGPRGLALANQISYRPELLDRAVPLMETFGQARSIHVLLAERRGLRRYILHCCTYSRNLPVHLNEVVFHDLFGTATGMVLSAFAPESERRRIAAARPEPSRYGAPDPEAVWAEIRRNRRAEFCDDQFCAAFPVYRDGQVVAALGLAALEYVFGPEERERLVAELGRVAAAIGRGISSGGAPV